MSSAYQGKSFQKKVVLPDLSGLAAEDVLLYENVVTVVKEKVSQSIWRRGTNFRVCSGIA